MFEFTELHGGIQNNFKDQMETLGDIIKDDDDYDSFLAKAFMDKVFDAEAMLDYEVWRTSIIKHTPFLFNPHELRLEVFKFAKVEYTPAE